jgi:hypothetical protein
MAVEDKEIIFKSYEVEFLPGKHDIWLIEVVGQVRGLSKVVN